MGAESDFAVSECASAADMAFRTRAVVAKVVRGTIGRRLGVGTHRRHVRQIMAEVVVVGLADVGEVEWLKVRAWVPVPGCRKPSTKQKNSTAVWIGTLRNFDTLACRWVSTRETAP